MANKTVLAAATFVVVCAFFGLAAGILYGAQQDVIDARNDVANTGAADTLEALAATQVAHAQSVRAFMISADPSRAQYLNFTTEIGAATGSVPGLQSVTFVRRVPAGERAAFEEEVRQDPTLPESFRENFTVRPWRGQSLEGRPHHDVPWLRSDPTGNPGAIGIDLGTEPVRQALFETAANNPGHAASTPVIPLFTDGIPGILIALAVEEDAQVAGFVLSVIFVEPWLEGQFQDVCVMPPGQECGPGGRFVDVAGQSWHVRAQSTRAPADSVALGLVIGAGLVAASAASAAAHLAVGRHQQLAALVDRRTTELEQRNKELREFAYVASHDLRAPLRHIAGFADLLEQDLQRKPEEVPHHLHTIKRSIARMNGLIDAVLHYAQAGETGMAAERVELDTVLAQALETLKPRIDETGATVESDPLPTVVGDAIQLEQAFQNILENALKFSDGAPRVHVRHRSEGKHAIIDFEDEGRGLDVRNETDIFSIFQRSHSKAGGGHGIGLSVVRRVMEVHGGTAEAFNNDKGATIRLRFRRPQ